MPRIGTDSAEVIRQSFALCSVDRRGGWCQIKVVENPRLQRERGEQAWHWASAVERPADQGSYRGSWPQRSESFMLSLLLLSFHAGKQNAGSNSFSSVLGSVCLASCICSCHDRGWQQKCFSTRCLRVFQTCFGVENYMYTNYFNNCWNCMFHKLVWCF